MKTRLMLILMLSLSAATVLAQDDIRDVKPPQGLPFPWWAMVILLLVAVIAAILFILFSDDKKKQAGASPLPALPPWEIALLRLNELQAKGLLVQGQFHDYYFELTDILRHYIEGRFDIDAPERTTEEFLIHMRELNVLTGAQKNMLKNFLIECDKVKFAKHAPTIEDGQWAFGIAKSFIEETRIKAEPEVKFDAV